MTTAQLTVLWYSCLFIIAILLYRAVDESSLSSLIAATVVLTVLLLYTLKPHPSARKRWVFVWVMSPFVAAGVEGAEATFGWCCALAVTAAVPKSAIRSTGNHAALREKREPLPVKLGCMIISGLSTQGIISFASLYWHSSG